MEYVGTKIDTIQIKIDIMAAHQVDNKPGSWILAKAVSISAHWSFCDTVVHQTHLKFSFSHLSWTSFIKLHVEENQS